jgi:hypothetical protein
MRSYTGFIICCLTGLILIASPVAALNVSAVLHEDGKAYSGCVIINQTERYEFIQSGMLGERIPLQISNLTVKNETGTLLQVKPDRGVLTLPNGNYTISYETSVSGNTIQILLPSPGNISITLPHPYMIGNPLLTSLQPGGSTTEKRNNTTEVFWSDERVVEMRYYDEQQERLLSFFAQFWMIIAVVLLLPFFLTRR